MALFKIFRGSKKDLPAKCTAGYAYITTDTGELFFDTVSTSASIAGTRIQVNARSATKLAAKMADGTFKTIEIPDIALKSDITALQNGISDVVHGGTGLTDLTLNAVMVGNGTDSVKLIPSDNGALYANQANGEPRFGILPVAQGGTGNITGNSLSATKLATARNIQTDLGNSNPVAFDGTADIAPGIIGILPIINGGTGNANGKAVSADKLETPRDITIDLTTTNAASFDGTASITPGVQGILSIANGGTGNANSSAIKLTNARTISLNQDITGSVSFDGSSNVTIPTTLANSGVVAGTYGPFLNGLCWMANNSGRANTTATWTLTAKKAGVLRFIYAGGGEENYDYLTISIKGTVKKSTKGELSPYGGYYEETLAVGDVVEFSHIEDSSNFYNGDYAGIGNLCLGAKNSDFEVITPGNISTYFTVANGTYTFEPMMVFTGASTTVDSKGRITKATNIFPTIYTLTEWQNIVGGGSSGGGNVATADKLATARTIQTNLASTSAASFDGTTDITPGITGTLAISHGGTGNTTGLAAIATKLANPRTVQINLNSTSAASFDGTANITPGITGILSVTHGGTGNATGIVPSATKLATARTISLSGDVTGSASFDGSNDITITTDIVNSGNADIPYLKGSGIAYANVAHNSIAFGNNSNASGASTIAIGIPSQVYANGSFTFVNTVASDINAIAIGRGAQASNSDSVSFGIDTYANNHSSIAIGQSILTNGRESVAIGCYSNVNGGGSVGIGRDVDASGYRSIAIGESSRANGDYSLAIGSFFQLNSNIYLTITDSSSALAIGRGARAMGYASIAIGCNLYSSGYNSIVIGSSSNGVEAWDSIVVGTNANIQSSTNSIAIGTNASVTADLGSIALGQAASVSTNNTIQLGGPHLSALRSTQQLTVASDERDKTDIEEIKNGATKFLNALKAVTFVYNQRELYRPKDPKKDENGNNIIEDGIDYLTEEDHKNIAKYGWCRYNIEEYKAGTKKGIRRRVGLLAQQTQKALAEVYGSADYANIVNDNLYDFNNVPEDIESTLTMNYEALIPFLIKGFQEQDAEIQALKTRIVELEKKML